MRTIELHGVENVRDLGGIPVGAGRVVAPGLLYRGSALAHATPADCDILFDKLHIERVIDVRCGWECAAAPDIEVPGVENLHIPFYDKEKVGIEYTEPAEGTKVVGRDVACVPEHFYRSLPNPLTAGQMRCALERAFEYASQGRAVYLHCSGGKDRAGILALLALTTLGANRADILDDYLLTNVSRNQHYASAFERFLKFADGDVERAHELTRAHDARRENLDAFYASVDERYGSMEKFLCEKLGMDAARRAKLREQCTCPAGADTAAPKRSAAFAAAR